MIGMGLMAAPALIDEPTTALDVTVQRQVLNLLARIRADDDVAILLISHDMSVIERMCERVLVRYAGRVVGELPAAELAQAPRHLPLPAPPPRRGRRDRPHRPGGQVRRDAATPHRRAAVPGQRDAGAARASRWLTSPRR